MKDNIISENEEVYLTGIFPYSHDVRIYKTYIYEWDGNVKIESTKYYSFLKEI